MLTNLTDDLKAHRKDIIDVSEMASLADGGAVYPYDMMVWAVTKRSICLIDSFIHLIETKNFMIAAALIRMHLDTVLRMHAATLSPKVHDFAEAVLGGKRVRDLKDRNGKKMTDSYLVKRFSERCDWAPSVYKETSGYIHLSSKHIYNTFEPPNKEGLSTIAMTAGDQFLPDEIREEAMEAMIEITKEIVLYIYGWAETKKRGAQPVTKEG